MIIRCRAISLLDGSLRVLTLFAIKPVDLFDVCLECCQGNLHVLVQLLIADSRVLLQGQDKVFSIRNSSHG